MDDVIVVGGGPTGFLTALGLARAGLHVRVIEAEPRIIASPRAAVYHWSVLEGIGRLGILAEAEAAGFRKQDYTYLVHATGEQIGYSLGVLEGRTATPYNLHLGQHRLADIAMRQLRSMPNATVEFDTRLAGLAQDDAGVTLSVETPGGAEERRARWVVGADGAGSTTRRLAGLPFEGMTWAERFVATNVWFDFERFGYGRTTFVVDARHGAIIVKLDDEGLWRCTYMEDGSLPEETYLERLPHAYADILPGADAYRVEASSPYRMHQRFAPRYRVGRVVLAGDAAHATNPTGGLGLTSGLFDAFALYPTLAAVLLDGADEAALDRYSDQRRAMFVDRASPRAVRNKRLIFHANGGGQALEEALAALRRMRDDPDVRRRELLFTKSLETAPPLG